ncbi:MAG: methyltransferase domain-containing protein, partial [Alphaproteobacteria bacterium]
MAEVEARHWWGVGRRRIVDHLIAALGLPADATILDAGCGTGGNLAMLARHGRVLAFELDPEARAIAAARSGLTIEPGQLPHALPAAAQRLDLVTLLDVLEHLDDDRAALQGLFERLAPGGRVVVTVPALPALWSRHDEAHHHRRRYRKGELVARARAAGFEIDLVSYYNFWLFPALAGVRLVDTLVKRGVDDGLSVPPAPL